MKKALFCLLFLCFLPLVIFGQSDYFSIDTLTTVGVKLVDGGKILNSRFCQLKARNKIIQYSPYQVEEYGFRDGRVYQSKEIKLTDSVQRVFLERLSKGSINLYFYKSKESKLYFIEKDSTLFINFLKDDSEKRGYKDQLHELMSDCSNVGNAIRFVSYRKNSLSEIADRYNSCVLKPFPHFRYGLLAGYEFAMLVLNTNNSNEYFDVFDYRYDGGFAAGLFIDNPIEVSFFSLHAEFFYSRHGYSYYKKVSGKDIDFVANISSLKLPVLLRYSYPSNIYRPFINAGGILSFDTKNETSLYETTVFDNTIIINNVHNVSLSRYHAGYSFGAGIERSINPQRSFFIEVRYNKLLENTWVFNESYINLMTGINF